MTEKEFIEKFRSEKPLYEKYGKYLKHIISTATDLAKVPHHWFVIEPSYRVKDEKSIVEKVFYRDKNYNDPYNDITDKVGLRFVLLTTDQVNTVSGIIESIKNLVSRKDRDYEREQNLNPTTFIYQSMHYIVSLKKPVLYENMELPIKTYCEVQIRTLLQHAYSELTHDTIYKPKTIAEPKTHRLVARSMALIETTDAIFAEVGKQVCLNRSKNEVICKSIMSQFGKQLSFEVQDKINNIILDVYSEYIPDLNELTNFIESKKYILSKVIEKSEFKLLYKQPIILLMYYFVSKYQSIALKLWPFTKEEIDPIYSDLGISIPVL